uniref:Transmembrane 4 L six family member 1 n=1 Tax=Paramormyrops kingsleyae TaxID=1676925 RepID=A0A3B3QHN1_9TELE
MHLYIMCLYVPITYQHLAQFKLGGVECSRQVWRILIGAVTGALTRGTKMPLSFMFAHITHSRVDRRAGRFSTTLLKGPALSGPTRGCSGCSIPRPDLLRRERRITFSRFTMCTGRCARCLGDLLFPLGLCAIVANILLFFPNGEVLDKDHITGHVWLFSGIIGGGFLVFLPAVVMRAAGSEDGCCANRCGMMVSIVMSAVGAVGSLYCMVVAAIGLRDGPLCWTSSGVLEYPFLNRTQDQSYLFNRTLWDECEKPRNVVLWNITLFSILLILGGLEVLLCLLQVFNGLFGCLCGTCMRKRQTGIA